MICTTIRSDIYSRGKLFSFFSNFVERFLGLVGDLVFNFVSNTFKCLSTEGWLNKSGTSTQWNARQSRQRTRRLSALSLLLESAKYTAVYYFLCKKALCLNLHNLWKSKQGTNKSAHVCVKGNWAEGGVDRDGTSFCIF